MAYKVNASHKYCGGNIECATSTTTTTTTKIAATGRRAARAELEVVEDVSEVRAVETSSESVEYSTTTTTSTVPAPKKRTRARVARATGDKVQYTGMLNVLRSYESLDGDARYTDKVPQHLNIPIAYLLSY